MQLNITRNRYKIIEDIKQQYRDIKKFQKGYTLYLLLFILLGNICSTFFSTVIQNANSLSIGAYLVVFFTFEIAVIILNNVIYAIFLKRVRESSLHFQDIKHYIEHLLPQILCVFILNVFQTLTSIISIQFLTVSNWLASLASIVFSLFYMIVAAVIAFKIMDKEYKVKQLISSSFNFVLQHWLKVLLPCLFLVIWTLIYNSILLMGINVGNTFIRIVGFLISAYFEMQILIAIAKIYQNEIK
ncbi:hypothetical protein WKT02_11360 [Erysipelotrichaceae bacterium HCN-30851]